MGKKASNGRGSVFKEPLFKVAKLMEKSQEDVNNLDQMEKEGSKVGPNVARMKSWTSKVQGLTFALSIREKRSRGERKRERKEKRSRERLKIDPQRLKRPSEGGPQY